MEVAATRNNLAAVHQRRGEYDEAEAFDTGADDYLDTQFDPLAVGTTTISISQPTGFLPPAGETAIVATVEPA